MPQHWYPRKLILANSLDFTYSHIRPSATFSEPSYLGLIAFSLLLIGYYLREYAGKSNSIFYLNLLTVCISQSKSGFIFAVSLILYSLISKREKLETPGKKTGKLLFIIATLVILFYYSLQSKFFESSSVADRLTKPAKLLISYLYEYPFGIPYYDRLKSTVSITQSDSWIALSHNGIFNILFDYGVVGLLLLLILITSVKREFPQILFLIFLAIQSGGFLDFDKVAIFLLINSCIDYFRTNLKVTSRMI